MARELRDPSEPVDEILFCPVVKPRLGVLGCDQRVHSGSCRNDAKSCPPPSLCLLSWPLFPLVCGVLALDRDMIGN